MANENGLLSLRPKPWKATAAWLPGGGAYDQQELLTTSAKIGPKYVNSQSFPLDEGEYFLQTLAAAPRVQFGAIDTSAADADILDYFIRNTMITIKVDNEDISEIPLSFLVPFAYVLTGTTWTLVPRENFIAYRMPDKIIVPEKKPLRLIVAPPTGLVTAPSAITNPHILGAGTTIPGVTSGGRSCFVEFQGNGIWSRTPSRPQ